MRITEPDLSGFFYVICLASSVGRAWDDLKPKNRGSRATQFEVFPFEELCRSIDQIAGANSWIWSVSNGDTFGELLIAVTDVRGAHRNISPEDFSHLLSFPPTAQWCGADPESSVVADFGMMNLRMNTYCQA
ncbi:hypothetical protein A6456_33985 [Paraburkholderia tropica]|nr:hypothetical protein A6456_33985 [Paraburkholderia tropica]